jgi:hypothetical protein
MARPRKGDVNVSAAIRDYLKANDVGPTEAAAAISKQIGKKVAPSFVSNVKAKMNGKPKKKGRRGRKPGRKPGSAAVTARAHSNGSVQLATIEAMKAIVGQVGASTAKQIIDLLS